jgi:hypothetical protein
MDGRVASAWKLGTEGRFSTRLRTANRLLDKPSLEKSSVCGVRARDFGLLLLLMCLAGGLRAWQISHTEVAARDSIGFIRAALQFEEQPAAEVIRNSQQHPGYPLAVMVVSWPVRYFMGGITPVSMQLSAQLTSALASILLVIPMYFLGRELFDRRAGFWGTALFQCLPVVSRTLSDALSEATFLLLITTALVLAVQGMRSNSPLRFAFCGLFGGLAYWTRPEGALVVIAAGLVLLGIQLFPAWRRSWKSTVICFTSLAVTALAVGTPYPVVTGKFTNKPSAGNILETGWITPDTGGPGHAPIHSNVPIAQPQTAFLFGVYAPDGLKDRRWWGLQAIATEIIRSYQYLAAFPVLLGLWWFRHRLRALPGAWVMIVLCLLHALVLWRLARVVGYVSDRHVLVLVLCGAFTGAAAVGAFGNWLAGRIDRWLGRPVSPRRAYWLSLILLAALTSFGLPDAFHTLHANRAGHRAAGLWLAAHTEPADIVYDPFCWAHYYAGRVFQEGTPPPAPPGFHPTYYVVLEKSSQEHNRLPTMPNALALAAIGTVVYHWPGDQPEDKAKILVYAVPTAR